MKKLSTICNCANIKPAVLLPILALTFLILGVGLWYAGLETKAAGAGQAAQGAPEAITLVTNPLFKELVSIPEIPADPGDTILLQSLFSDAAEAAAAVRLTGQNSRQANKEIRSALVDALEDFLRTHPDSAWVPSLQCNLGLYYRKAGRPTLALAHWEKTWMQLNESNHPVTKKIADKSFAHWTSLLASLGRVDELTVLLEATRERNFGLGETRLLMYKTLEGYNQMVADLASAYRCGSLALANMAKKMGAPEQAIVQFLLRGPPGVTLK